MMNSPLIISLAVRLCSADMCCGFIPVAPVLGNRDELIQQRLTWYQEWLQPLSSRLLEDTQTPADIFPHLLTLAVKLTSTDMLCDAIALVPVLYDRDSRIRESVASYFSWFQVCAGASNDDSAVAARHPE